MAGESPDTSDQQKSSGETTRGEHDPRFAVFRDAGSPRKTETSAEAERTPDAKRSSGTESSGTVPEDDRTDRADGTDGADGADGTDGADGDGAGGSGADPDAPAAKAPGGRATTVLRAVTPEAAAESTDGADGGSGRRADGDGTAADPAAGAEAEGEPESGDAAGSGTADVTGVARAAASGPARDTGPARTADTDASDSGAPDPDGPDDAADGETDEPGTRPAQRPLPVRPGTRNGTAGSGDAAAPNGGRKAGGTADERGEPAPAGGDERLRDAVAAWVSGGPEASEDAAGAGRDRAASAAGASAGKAEGKDTAAEAEGSGEDTRTLAFGTLRDLPDTPADRATAFFGTVRATGRGTATAEPGTDGETESGANGTAGSGGAGADGAAARRATDRATAFFGAVRPSVTAPGAAGNGTVSDGGTANGDEDGDAAGGTAERRDRGKSGADRAAERDGGKGDDTRRDGAKDGDKKAAGAKTAGAKDTDKKDTVKEDEDADGAADPAARRDRATSVLGTVRPPAKAGGKTGDKTGDRPAGTSAEPKKPEPKKPAGDGTGKPAAGADGRPSTFVPLRSADDPDTGRKPRNGTAPAPATTAPRAGAEAPAAAGAAPAAGTGTLPESERTRQQPLPPVGEPAPLDLLAQLTNTPPPPETPVRTIVRRIKIWTPLVLLLVIIFGVVQALRPLPEPELRSAGQTSFTFEGERFTMPWPGEGQAAALVEGVGSLGTYGAQKPVPIASVGKVMTAYVVLKSHPLKPDEPGQRITIDAQAGREAGNKDESRVPVEEGQKFTLRQMLEMTMIPSGNNVARQLARWDAGSEQAFLKKMNDAARDLGMTNTTYTDPSGLKASTQSTAEDQLKLASAVMKIETFRKIVATPDIEIPGVGRIFNNNRLVADPDLVVRGIKTGSNTPAGGALMWATYRTVGGKDRLVLGVTLDQRTGSTDPNAHLALVLDESEKQIKAVRKALTAATLVRKGQVVGEVDDGLGGTTPVVATKDLQGAGWPGHEVEFKLTVNGDGLPHSAKAGTVIGQLNVGTGPERATVPVALQKDLAEPGFGDKLTRLG